VLFPEVPEYHLRFRLLEESRHFPFTNDIELHILELPKFTKSASELTSGLDIWLYFLRHAEKMDTEALPLAFQQYPLVLRALEELKMLSQTDSERERYETRRKAQLDYDTGLKVARMEGLEEGREQGRMEGEKTGVIRLIHLCEGLLKRDETPMEQLAALPLEALSRMADDLQERLRTR
jgi:predicted transposase/invertase (TIGR01784 family)